MDGLRWLQAQWDRTAALTLIGAGFVLIAGAAAQARNGLYVPDQLSLLMSGGLGGFACAALGAALMVSAALHDEWRALDDIATAIQDHPGRDAGEPFRGPLGVRRISAERDRLCGGALVVASFVWLLIGYRHLAGSLYPPAQIAYLISSGLGPLGCLLAGLAVVLRADLRDEQHKLCQIEWALTGDTQSEVEGRLVLRPGGTVALLVLAVVVEGLGWARAAHALEADRAMEGLDVAVAGLGAAFLVVGVATISVRRRFVDHAAQVLARLRETDASGHPMRAGTSVPGYWTVAGLRRYHRVLCPALTSARGELQPVSDRAPGLEPCLLCDAGE